MIFKYHLLLIAKYGFLSTMITGAGLLIFYTTEVNWFRNDNEFIQNNTEALFDDAFRALDANFEECITDPSKIFCLVSTNERLKTIIQSQDETHEKNIEINPNRKHPMHALLDDFCAVAQSLGVSPILIEPSILFCMLTEEYKLQLLQKGLNLTELKGSERVVTLAVMDTDADLLSMPEAETIIASQGFVPKVVYRTVVEWMEPSPGFNVPIHQFYERGQLLIHVVVFHRRNNYLWHAAMPNGINQLDVFNDLLFIKEDSAFEKFTFLTLRNSSLQAIVTIPSNLQHFLFEIASSKFLECKSRSASVVPTAGHALEQFRSKTIVAIRELKMRFSEPMIRFWMFSGTLLGWYRQCDIIPYTSDVDFGAWITDVVDLENIERVIYNNPHLRRVERMGLVEEGLEFRLDSHGLRVDLFFFYKDENRTWMDVHRPDRQLYIRMYYPHFGICSADLLGEKVNVPCEAEEVIVSEYGPSWQVPVEKWTYHESPLNLDKPQKWNESQLNKTFQSYS